MGEFKPILLVTLILSTTHPLHEAVILIAFVVLAVLLALVAVRSMFKGWPLITSGMKFDLHELVSSAGTLLKLPLFLGMFLVVRGVPALVLYRRVLAARDRLALALLCATELPLVVAITTLAVETGHMRASTSAALVGAAMVSTLVFPLLALRLRRPGPAVLA